MPILNQTLLITIFIGSIIIAYEALQTIDTVLRMH